MTKYIALLGMVSVTVLSAVGIRLPSAQSNFTSQAENQLNTFTSLSASPSPTGSAPPTPSPPPTSVPGIANHIVISEVQITGGTGLTDRDFIELYNPTASPIDLNGFRLVKRTSGISAVDDTIKSWTSSTIVPAHSFYLWANSASGFATTIGADASTTDTLSSDNSIAIRQGAENTGVIIDAIGWGSSGSHSLKESNNFLPNMTASQSAERKAYSISTAGTMNGADSSKGNGFDQNDNSTDFVLRMTAEPQNSSSPSEVP